MTQAILLEIRRRGLRHTAPLGLGRPSGMRDLSVDDTDQTFLDNVGGKAVQVGLERIPGENAVRENPRLAGNRLHLPRQQLGDQLFHRRIAQVQPVPGFVEAIAVALVGARVPPQACLLLEQHPRRAQMDRRGDTGQSAPENHDLLRCGCHVEVLRLYHGRSGIGHARAGRVQPSLGGPDGPDGR